MDSQFTVVAIGPEMPGWGSWNWIGADIQEELSRHFQMVSFKGQTIPQCDVLMVVKHALPMDIVEAVSQRTAIIYCPVDYYGSAAEIDADGPMLRKCSRILIHCEPLRRYFEPYSPVELMDHHVKFAAPIRKTYRAEGFFLWVGVRSNWPPFVEWLNEHPLPGELRILTNPQDPKLVPQPTELGFRPGQLIRIEAWNKERHRELAAVARAAIDIKGSDFRSRHKPPAKAIDFIASGLPLAMNSDSCVVEHLARMGFEIPSPLEVDRWLSKEYWQETQRFGKALRELLSLERIGRRVRRIIDDVLLERPME